jgi:hypothetical protein
MNDNRDEAFLLAAVDQLEAAILAGEHGAEQRAREFIANAMDDRNGVMFLLQGVKAMLTWMQNDGSDK